MKKNLTKKAFTLIELILAIVLVVIVILGIFSVNMVLSNNNQDYGQKYLVRSQTQITLNHMLNNATLAVGSGTTDANGNLDLGIQVGPGGQVKWGAVSNGGFQNAETVCMHQAANNNLINYTSGDIWLCYTWYPPGDVAGSDYQIKYCAVPFNDAANLRGATNCNFATANGFTLLAGPTYLGTSNSDLMTNASFGANGTNPGSQMLFSLTLQNCLNNAASTCNGNGQIPGSTPGISSDPVNNPEVSLTGSTFPTQEGMQNTN